jgi:hypothetical protein
MPTKENDVVASEEEFGRMLSLMGLLLPFMDYMNPKSAENSKPFEDAFQTARDRAVQLANEFVSRSRAANAL